MTMRDISSLGTILGIWAHPDDESWLSAGLMMAARQNGQRVVCVTATKGEGGVQDENTWPAAELAAIREKELYDSLELMDITEHHWLGYSDGLCADVPVSEAVSKLLPIISDCQPDTIITFGPDGLSGHPDHQTVSLWAQAAVNALTGHKPTILHVATTQEWYEAGGKEWDEKCNVFFNLDEPPLIPEAQADIVFRLPPELIDRKLAVLRAQPSQTAQTFTLLSDQTLAKVAGCECFVKA